MSEYVLEVTNLQKRYGKYQAVKGISFQVPRGKIIGLLGPNGAGKTTTIQMLTGVTLHDGGTINYFGKDFATHRKECLQRINFASSFNSLQGRISAYENLIVFSDLLNIKNAKQKIADLAEYFEITHILHDRYWDLSAGQKTRVNLVKSLLNDPELILMDEPTASLDPDIADKVLTLIEKLNKERQLSILYTSHDMEEVTRICDEVIFLDQGEIFAQDTPLGLTKQIGKTSLILTFDGKKQIMQDYLEQNHHVFSFPNKNTVKIEIEEKLLPKLLFGISSHQEIWITDIEVKKPTLEDFFLHIARKEDN